MNTVISFSCPAHLAMRLNEQNIPSREKSKWISDAITSKLDNKNALFTLEKRDILSRSVAILVRTDPALAKLLQDHIWSHYPQDD